MPVLHGKAVTTVEGVALDRTPHPVQQAMVECHASQCGFCTPGFVMSLYADFRRQAAREVSRAEIDQMLSGNLCRCTGYRPIADAARQALATPRSEAESARDQAEERSLRALARGAGELVLDGPAGKWFSPASEDALSRCLAAHPDARMIAGLTDVGLWSTKQLRSFDKLVYIGEIDSLRRVKAGRGVLAIGAAVTWSDAIPHLLRHWPEMTDMLQRFASPPVRNTATVGGNVANGSPIGDSMPAFIALGASIVLRGAGGERSMPLEDFYIAYQKTALAAGEYVAEIRVPLPVRGQVFRIYKISKRFDQDISALCAGLSLGLEKGVVRAARLAFGGMAATPTRAAHAERVLVGRVWDAATVAAAQDALGADFQPITDMRASAAYRQVVARNLLMRLFLETRPADGGDTAVRLADLEVMS
jgi:xanthine dehydrogenase small subunit